MSVQESKSNYFFSELNSKVVFLDFELSNGSVFRHTSRKHKHHYQTVQTHNNNVKTFQSDKNKGYHFQK